MDYERMNRRSSALLLAGAAIVIGAALWPKINHGPRLIAAGILLAIAIAGIALRSRIGKIQPSFSLEFLYLS